MIVDYDYYSNTYYGEPVDIEEYPRFAARAEDAVATVTHGRATASELPALSATQREAVTKAICAQIEYYAWYGINAAVAGPVGGGFTVGKVSVSSGANGGGASAGKSLICPSARAALELTGLCYPGVAAC